MEQALRIQAQLESGDDDQVSAGARGLLSLLKIEEVAEARAESWPDLSAITDVYLAVSTLITKLKHLGRRASLTIEADDGLWALDLGELNGLKRLHVKGLTPSHCASLSAFIARAPNLEELTIDRMINMELREALSPFVDLIVLVNLETRLLRSY